MDPFRTGTCVTVQPGEPLPFVGLERGRGHSVVCVKHPTACRPPVARCTVENGRGCLPLVDILLSWRTKVTIACDASSRGTRQKPEVESGAEPAILRQPEKAKAWG